MADIVSKITVPNIGTYGIRSGYLYYATTTATGGTYHDYTATVTDSLNGTITVPSYEKGLTLLVKLSGNIVSTVSGVRFRIGTSLGFVNLYYGTVGTVNPKTYIANGGTYLVFYDGQYFRIINSYYDTFKSGSNVLAASNSGSSNATSATANNSTYLNHVEGGSVVSSVQVIGSGATTVSANNGVLTITSTGGTSTDEKLTVSTFTEYATKPIVLHDGGGSNGTGYTTPYLTLQRFGNDGSNNYNNELIIGQKSAAASDGVSSKYCGSIFLTKGFGNGTSPSGGHIVPNQSTSGEKTYQLPFIDGEILSKGGLQELSSSTSKTNGIQNTTYYQCGYYAGKIYAPAMGTSSGGGSVRDTFVNSAYWSDGTTSGPSLVLGYNASALGTITAGSIPSASTVQSGVITTGPQSLIGGKTFYGGIATEGLSVIGTDKHIYYQAAINQPLYTYELPRQSGLIPIMPNGSVSADGIACIGTANGEIAVGPLFDYNQDGKFLAHDGTWKVPSGGGGGTHYEGKNVFANSANSVTNATTATSNSSTYLNHVENGSVTNGGSLVIIGSGNTTVSAKNGILTITSTDGGGSNHIGALVISTTSSGQTNAATTTNNNTYLNHVEGGGVQSSLKIIGTGNTTVSYNNTNSTLTITSTGSGRALCDNVASGLVDVIVPEVNDPIEALLPERSLMLPVLSVAYEGSGPLFGDNRINGYLQEKSEWYHGMYPNDSNSTDYLESAQAGALMVSLPYILVKFLDIIVPFTVDYSLDDIMTALAMAIQERL